MAEAISSFTCTICLDLLKDPVTIPCGHSYCMGCIKGCLDQEEDKGIYSCPQCRKTFMPRPMLNRNATLAVVVETLKKTRLQAAPPDLYYAGPGDVECDSCTGRKLKAVKSCMICLVSFCETHLQPHYVSPAYKKHTLVQASSQLKERICTHHEKYMEIYCRTDQQCICYLCKMHEHKGHDTVSTAAACTEKQKQLRENHKKCEKRIQEREKEIQELRQTVDSLKCSAQTAVEDNERIFTELIRCIQKRRTELKKQIRAQEKAEVSRAERHLKQLEQEVAELRMRDVEQMQLLHTEDHIHFLQSFQSLSVSPGSEVFPSTNVNPHISFEHVMLSVSELKDRLQDVCTQEMDKISGKVTTVTIAPPAEPKTREDFLTYSCQLSMDPNSAYQHLCLSEGNKNVTCSEKALCYPDHPDRFTFYSQVLCREGLSGACYWEVEWCGDAVGVAVSYEGISRKGRGYECGFGRNDQSWRLSCSISKCHFIHNNYRTDVPVPCSSRVGVYLDHKAGTLSFYSVSDTMTLIHKVQTKFTQPLYPGFLAYYGTSVKILTPIQ